MADDQVYDPVAFRAFEPATWEEAAKVYSELLFETSRQVEGPMLEAVAAAPGTRLLDVACGPGWLAGAASQNGVQATGLDFSPNMLSEARARYPAIDFQEGDAEALPFPDSSFEAVVCGFGLHHFPHPDRAAEEFFRVLASGGRFAFTAWCPPERSPFLALLMGAIKAHGTADPGLPSRPPQFQFDEPKACRAFLENTGFASCGTAEIPVMVRRERPDLVVEGCLRGGGRSRALLLAQPQGALENIKAAIAEGLRKYEKNGGVEIPRPAILAWGRKP